MSCDIEIIENAIVLKTIKCFKARTWRDYAGLGEGIIDAHLKEKKTEKEVCYEFWNNNNKNG